jgi:hypothetical protein
MDRKRVCFEGFACRERCEFVSAVVSELWDRMHSTVRVHNTVCTHRTLRMRTAVRMRK